MKKYFLAILIGFQFTPYICNGFSLSDEKKKDIGNFLLQSIYWQKYWFNVWDDNEFNKFVKNKTIKVFIAPDRYTPDELNVYLPDLNSLICLSEDGNKYLVINVYNYGTRDIYESQRKKEIDGNDCALIFSEKPKQILDFGPFDLKKIDFTKQKLTEVLAKDSRGNVLTDSFDVKVGNFNRNYPDIYFYVIGNQYYGYMDLDIETGEILLKGLEYNGDEPIDRHILSEIKRIDETGKAFRFEKEKLEVIK